ncbi:MAG: VOC family protein [Streptosporangiales bacterium]|nr:VOC family protein [Streptosporangiales bacterium]
MTSYIRTITFDSGPDPSRLGEFWRKVTGFIDVPDNPNEPGDPEWVLQDPKGVYHLLFIPVPEGKTVKNRVHLDMVPTDRTRDEEVERLLGLGATQVADFRKPDGSGFVVLADPEGNEFCVERSEAERAAG